jgi:hypothetical protein
MSNDAKWMKKEIELPFTPYPGMNFEGITGEQPLKISGMSYMVTEDCFKLRLAWLSDKPLNSKEMIALDIGWELAI